MAAVAQRSRRRGKPRVRTSVPGGRVARLAPPPSRVSRDLTACHQRHVRGQRVQVADRLDSGTSVLAAAEFCPDVR